MATKKKYNRYWAIIYKNKINSIKNRVISKSYTIPSTPALIVKSYNKLPLRTYVTYGDFKYYGRCKGILIYKTKVVKGSYLVLHLQRNIE